MELTRKQKKSLYELGILLYQKKGQEAVEALGDLFDLDPNYCEPCNGIEPSLDGACFVCGSSHA